MLCSDVKLVTTPTQQFGCPSQTSTVPDLLTAHSDGVVDSVINVSSACYVSIR